MQSTMMPAIDAMIGSFRSTGNISAVPVSDVPTPVRDFDSVDSTYALEPPDDERGVLSGA